MANVTATDWTSDALNRLAASNCKYHADGPNAAEPAALAAIALCGAGRGDAAQTHLDWLGGMQIANGSVPPFAQLEGPGWPTPLAMLAWSIASARAAPNAGAATPSSDEANSPAVAYRGAAKQGIKWLESVAGMTLPKSSDFGHDGMLVGWPWVVGTHSWQEPTAWSVLALKAAGMADHSRTREGVRMLVDRLLPHGGCNYGNTYVLGQQLRPHVEPTGITMVALAGESSDDLRIDYSLQYLAGAISAETTAISLGYGLLGLTAHNHRPVEADDWLATAYRRTIQREAAPLAIALLVLAAQGKECPLIKFTVA